MLFCFSGNVPSRSFLICCYLYGLSAIVLKFRLTALVTFGGPPRDQLPGFLFKLWAFSASFLVPLELNLRRVVNKKIP
ncbi:hypothetical protein HG15A2_10970 [Adhaeretor mobilis]|uniref:Uncharacterized protein n=1 Tax=Adhaeretor mobilis TaxID=1930276 RepID=A0A517MSG9_9BACT|nr:hypothetical protein HG15A2_10970 [Adhaeretor mobilis]